MRTFCLRVIVVLTLLVGIGAYARAQTQNATYVLSGEFMRTVYSLGIRALDHHDYLVAHRWLSTYQSIVFHYGVFSQNPQFMAELNRALQEIEGYYQQEVAKRQTFQSQLLQCQRRLHPGMRTEGKAAAVSIGSQLPRVPPER